MKTRKLQAVGTTLLLMLFLCVNGVWAENQEVSRQKEYTQSFAAKPDNNLLIDSKYSDIVISHWKKDEIAFRVVVTATARNEKLAQETLEKIRITLKKEGKTIKGLTDILSSKVNKGGGNFNICYYVSMPAWITTNLELKYGNIQLPETNKATTNVGLKYGDIKAGSFSSILNLDLDYGNALLGSFENTANLRLAYCGDVKVEDANILNIESKYSNLKLGKIGILNIESKYGQLHIKEVNTLNSRIKYSEAKIEYLERNINCELSYSNIDIVKTDATFDHITVNSRYGNLYVGLPENASFKVEAEGITYGDCDVSRRFKATHYEKHNSSAYYEINNGRNGNIKFDGGGYGKIIVGVSD